MLKDLKISQIKKLLKVSQKSPFATKNYPSRGQTAVQEIYQTSSGKLFLKKSSPRNHCECQIDPQTGSIAEREFWAFQLAHALQLNVPYLWLLDKNTTVQIWLDIPDARLFATSFGKLSLKAINVFECALFDWLTGQVDRHDANYLYDFVQQEIILIDSAHSFLKYEGSIPDYLKYFEIGFSKQLNGTLFSPFQERLKKLSTQQINKLVPLKNQEEKQALHQRWKQCKEVKSIQAIIDLYRGERR